MKKVLIYTVHKAASMFLHKLGTDIEKKLDMDFYSINNNAFRNQIKDVSWKEFIEKTSGASCFGPIRAGEDVALPVFPDNLDDYVIILHLRDPRDVLTSAYYSHVFSHPDTKIFKPSHDQKDNWEKAGVDNFVLKRVDRVKKEYEELCAHMLGKNNVILVKYEDMVTNYGAWLKDFMSGFSSFEIRKTSLIGSLFAPGSHDELYDFLFKKHAGDFLPEKKREDVHSHKRQVTPGDHARKLKQSTIDSINSDFSSVLSKLNYK